VTEYGYALVRCASHPRARAGGYVLEHRLAWEEANGRFLERDEQIHHINGDKLDNRPDNLQLTTPSAHMALDLMTDHGKRRTASIIAAHRTPESRKLQRERMTEIWRQRRLGLLPLPKSPKH